MSRDFDFECQVVKSAFRNIRTPVHPELNQMLEWLFRFVVCRFHKL